MLLCLAGSSSALMWTGPCAGAMPEAESLFGTGVGADGAAGRAAHAPAALSEGVSGLGRGTGAQQHPRWHPG